MPSTTGSIPHDPRRYLDWAGCGNTLDLGHPRVLQLAMDALRHWAGLGVDGFRFDLAPALGRDRAGAFRPDAALLQAIAQDPVLGRLKLIAEPWDLGPDGYRQGQFPPPFAMWNDRFRDCVRRFWRGDEAILPELAGRLLGSADLFEARGPPAAGQRQLRHQPRRLHAGRPRQLRRSATTRPMARATATATTTISAPITASRVRPTIRRSPRCARRQQPQPAGDAPVLPRARRCC